MALANYADLGTSVAAWTHRSDLTSIIPDFVTMAEARIARDLRLRKQITTSTLTTVAATQSVALPTDWLEFENVSVALTPERQLTYVPIEHMDSIYPSGSGNSSPIVYTIEGDNILFGPVPDTAYTVNIVYYSRFASLITSSTNWLMTNHPNIYLFAVLIEAYTYLQDKEQSGVYAQRYMQELAQLQFVDDRSARSGSALRVRAV